MQASKYLVIGSLLCIVACIEPFQPEIRENQDLMVVNGVITDSPGMHYVEVSRASPYNQPAFIPVQGCVVQVEDDEGSGETYTEYGPGKYGALLDRPFLGPGKSYRVRVFTPDGKEYQSDFDPLLPSPRLDRLYFGIESQETEDPEKTYYGLQFYIDVKPEVGATRNVLWKLEETYEYTSSHLIQSIWDGRTLFEFIPATDSLYTCYKTQPVKELFTASTRNLVNNELTHYPLNYVSNQTTKLRIKYSLLVSQYSLSDEAFLYWDKIKSQMKETGGMYETQPSVSGSNIHNVNDPAEQVLGYFYASQVTEQRIIVKNTFNFNVPRLICPLDTVYSISELESRLYYLISFNPYGGGPPYGTASPACFNCTMLGGTTEPPEYWNQDE